MQPMVSPIDHESRHNSYREERGTPAPTAATPLLARFPPVQTVRASRSTPAVVSLLMFVLLSGVIIGVYLLIVQSNSENVLPPIDRPLQFVSRQQWDPEGSKSPTRPLAPRATRVLVMQTDSQECYSVTSCAVILHDMQNITSSPDEDLPYNFVVSSNGQTFEVAGWRHAPRPLAPPALVLGFIGNFTESPPSRAQVDEAKNFFAESVSLRRLHSRYDIVGRATKYTPKKLFDTLRRLPQWNKVDSDS